jgi:hypothetical protein
MKTRTVITTEKREVWIIRQPSGDPEALDTPSHEGTSPDSLTTARDRSSGTDSSPGKHEHRGEKGEKAKG